jgi:hypothetical protein
LQNLKEITLSAHTGGCEYLLPYLPGNGARKELDADGVDIWITDQLGTLRGRYDEHNNSFPSVRNQGLSVQ